MHKIFSLPTWLVFIFLIVPAIFPSSIFGLLLTSLWLLIFSFSVFFLVTKLYLKLPETHDLQIRRFNFCFFFSLIYIVIISLSFKNGYDINQDNYREFGWSIYLILPLHLVLMFCIFYMIRFIAKAIKTIERSKIVGPDAYVGLFFLIWFLPIGIWWIYPKIRKIFS